MSMVMACALSACGGGGNGGDSDEPETAASRPPAAAPLPEPAPPAAAGTRATCDLADFEATVIAAVNAWRARGAVCGAQPYPAARALAWSNPLAQASLLHSDDMMAHNIFSHTGSDGSNAGRRASASGYAWRTWGENIAAGQADVTTVVEGWMASPGHCANVMNAGFRDIGVACVKGGSGNSYHTYWTMVLGAQ